MALWDAFKRARSPGASTGLLNAIITAVASNDADAFSAVVANNRETIRQRFSEWQQIPAAIRNDQAAFERYAQTLIHIASAFERLGDASLMAMLRGHPNDNPLDKWSRDIVTARTLIDAHRADEAVKLLTTLLAEIDNTSGSGGTHFRPRVLGTLGIALHHAGDTARAVKVTREARELCEKAGDRKGVEAYTQNLDAMGTIVVPARGSSDGTHTLVVRDEKGRRLTFDELLAARGKLQYEIRGGDAVPAEAARLHEEGRLTGARGEYDEAISLFTTAANLAPSWPYPVYDRAFTHLLKQDFASALADYRKTLDLAPEGFFTAAESAEMLSREVAGQIPSGLFATFMIHGRSLPPEARRDLAEQIIEKHPGFTPAWSDLIDLTEGDSARQKVIERAFVSTPDAHTSAMWRIQKAITVSSLGIRQKRPRC